MTSAIRGARARKAPLGRPANRHDPPKPRTSRSGRQRPRVAYLVASEYPANFVDRDWEIVSDALQKLGLDVVKVPWDGDGVSAESLAKEFDTVLHGSPWNNWEKMFDYQRLVKKLDKLGVPQVNPAEVVWPGRAKTYLGKLTARIVPTKIVPPQGPRRQRSNRKHLGNETNLSRAEQLFMINGKMCKSIVIKPVSSGGSLGAKRFDLSESAKALEWFHKLQLGGFEPLPSQHEKFEKKRVEIGSFDVLIQEELMQIRECGEINIEVINGVATHAYRKESILDQEPDENRNLPFHPGKQPFALTPQLVELAETVFEQLHNYYGFSKRSAIRVDVIDGHVLEVEMIAPVKGFELINRMSDTGEFLHWDAGQKGLQAYVKAIAESAGLEVDQAVLLQIGAPPPDRDFELV